MKLTTKADTVFKLHPVPSSTLQGVDKAAISKGFSREIHSVDPDDEAGHLKVAFAEPVLGNKNTVWVFAEHVVFEGIGASGDGDVRTFTGKIDWHDPRCRVSRFFSVLDVTKGDPRRIPVPGSQTEKNVLWMAGELDKLRDAWGGPVGVTSWYRSPEVNRQVGGARNSQHLRGWGVDIYCMQGNIFEFQSWLDKRWNRALGYGGKRGFIHLDGRGPGSRIRWHY